MIEEQGTRKKGETKGQKRELECFGHIDTRTRQMEEGYE